ncbi:MAG: hypothetical protein GDA36_10150 [Rhodobacteraceae bacterium]|nr:hypothetical protein [Paracoccaceae bacterium]
MQGGVHDDLLAGVYRQIKDHEPKRRPRQSRRAFHADTQARWVRNGAKRTPGDKMTSRRLCPPGRGRDEA